MAKKFELELIQIDNIYKQIDQLVRYSDALALVGQEVFSYRLQQATRQISLNLGSIQVSLLEKNK